MATFARSISERLGQQAVQCSEQAAKLIYNTGAGLLQLTAIKLLKARVGRIEGDISSHTLEDLHCEDTTQEAQAIHSWSVTGILGQQPQLRVLSLTSCPDSYHTKVSSATLVCSEAELANRSTDSALSGNP